MGAAPCRPRAGGGGGVPALRWGGPGVLRVPADSSSQGLMSQRIPRTLGMLRNRPPQVRVRSAPTSTRSLRKVRAPPPMSPLSAEAREIPGPGPPGFLLHPLGFFISCQHVICIRCCL